MINTGSKSIACNDATKKKQEGAADDSSFEKIRTRIVLYAGVKRHSNQ